MTIDEWKTQQTQKKASGYAHFDYRVNLETCWKYISDPDNVAKHGFYPYIHYEALSRRIKAGKKADPKPRQIYYAAHIDSWIYRYYSYLLNEKYNSLVGKLGLSDVAIAYRTDLGLNNIDFAKEAFSFIREVENCYVIIGDFTNFFDMLDHAYLKQRICSLLEVDKLPSDHYAVYKSATKFSFVELNKLLDLNNLSTSDKDRKKLNKKQRAISLSKFRELKSDIVEPHNKSYGTPQGSAISSTFANIYMLEADKEINDFVLSQNGKYMRYSDDFIAIFPGSDTDTFLTQYQKVTNIINDVPGLILQGEKTKIFQVSRSVVNNLSSMYIPNATSTKASIDFLGFSFDGSSVTIRDKTISKYYHRLYRKAKTITDNGGVLPSGKRISGKRLYENYSFKGTNAYQHRHPESSQSSKHKRVYKGNFLDYVIRAKKQFPHDPIDKSTKKHMQKIQRYLSENMHSKQDK